ncbi:MAG: hypothetical protein E6496_07840 [Lachnoanaerobaculum sp.]|jgi:hypothetical protein|nr:hypothetical protein [Lachnoanaerobaculum sp.]
MFSPQVFNSCNSSYGSIPLAESSKEEGSSESTESKGGKIGISMPTKSLER